MQRSNGRDCLVYRHPYSLIRKLLAFSVLLAALVWLVSQLPVLWELALAGLIGGVYWIFFRVPPLDD